MMDNKENQITSRQLMNMTISVQIGLGVLALPNNLALKCGHDGWITIILAGGVVTGIAIIGMLLLQRYNNQSIYGITKLLYGKYLGGLFNTVIVLYLWLGAAHFFRIFIDIIKLSVLKMTPPIVLSAFIMLTICYLTWNGLKNVARFAVLIYFIIIFSLILFAAVHRDLRLTFLMPVNEIGIKNILNGFEDCMYAYLGYGLTFIIYPEITNKNKAMKHLVGANIVTGIFMLTIVLTCTSFFGEEMMKYAPYPILKLSRSFRAPIFERVDVLFISAWFPAMFMTVVGYFSVCYYSINKLLNLKKRKTNLIVFSIINVMLSRIPRNTSQILSLFNTIMVRYAYVFLSIVIISYAFSFINKRGVKQSE